MMSPLLDWHVLFTAYLERISFGIVDCATDEEKVLAARWDAIQKDIRERQEQYCWDAEPSLKPLARARRR